MRQKQKREERQLELARFYTEKVYAGDIATSSKGVESNDQDNDFHKPIEGMILIGNRQKEFKNQKSWTQL